MAIKLQNVIIFAFLARLLVGAEDTDTPRKPNFNFDGFGGGGSKSCPAFKCAKGKEAAPVSPFKPTGYGCSGMGGGMVMSMGQDEGPVEGCCSRRTACFGTCGASKAACERDFTSCTKSTCAAEPDEEAREACKKSADLQVMLAGLTGGCQEFAAAQAAGCQCMSPEKAAARREKTLTGFYKKHAPEEGPSKAAALLAKAGDDVKKFAALLTRLIAKYPQAIHTTKTKNQQMYEDIFKDAQEKKGGDGEEEDAAAAAGGDGGGSGEGSGSEVEDLDEVLRQEL